jgi:hypothetical protein
MRFQPRTFEIGCANGRTHLVVSNPFHIDGKIVGSITTYTESDYGSYGFAGAVAKPYNITELGQLLSSVLSTT